MNVRIQEGKGYYVDKRSGQIPAFGNWEYVNDLPITQYFESARQAGLFRYSNSSSGECAADLNYFKEKPPPQKQKTRSTLSNKGYDQKTNQVKKKIKQLDDVTEPPRKQLHEYLPKHNNNNIAVRRQVQPRRTATTPRVVRAVDEDLYKIPPDLLHTSKRKRRLGLFSRCLVPDCMV
ncbi:hypothetical protein RHMOL_Rhmol09G0186200 [Rhododendron molle]|uniref:Uncharacterized protein n=1 Tax=Rhododendron molle TaxID=49168 RepID=A0ACC0MF37_RHOML|nr:hypothetical protein RHMOL_Rhmol09G0186200 [Rhododendron molle]